MINKIKLVLKIKNNIIHQLLINIINKNYYLKNNKTIK